MTPSRGSKSSPKEALALPLSFAPISPYCPLQIREISCSFIARMTPQHPPCFHDDGKQVRQRQRMEVRPRVGLGFMRAETPAPSLTRPEGHGDKESPSSPTEQWPPHCSLLQTGLRELPTPHLFLALISPHHPSLPLYFSESAHLFRVPWEGYTSFSLLCCPLPRFILKHPTLITSRMRGCAGI